MYTFFLSEMRCKYEYAGYAFKSLIYGRRSWHPKVLWNQHPTVRAVDNEYA